MSIKINSQTLYKTVIQKKSVQESFDKIVSLTSKK